MTADQIIGALIGVLLLTVGIFMFLFGIGRDATKRDWVIIVGSLLPLTSGPTLIVLALLDRYTM